jgi:antitoxin HigA-1
MAMRTRSRSSTATRRTSSRKVQAPVHPGEVLTEDFLKPMGITQYRLAKGTRVPPRRINEIVHGVRSITADTALRLGRFFGTSEQFWLNLQTRYDLEMERDRLGSRLLKDVEVWERARSFHRSG